MRFRYLPDMGPNYVGQLFLESLEGFLCFLKEETRYPIGSIKLLKDYSTFFLL